MNLEEIKTEIINLPIESQWELLEDLIKNLRVQIEQKQNSHFDIPIPNKTTLKVIAEAEKGINLIACDNADDLFRRLGI